ncbi:MAG: DUF4440 domain-containing protein [Acidimicrobiia bacterium]
MSSAPYAGDDEADYQQGSVVVGMGRLGRDRGQPWSAELEEAESALLDPEVRADPQALDSLIADDFMEVGSSGRIYDKKTLIELITGEEHVPVLIRDFSTRELASDVVLVTYRSVGQSGRAARRSSIWVCNDGSWQIVFHQGTLLPNQLGPMG